jgi:hypothetical protein
MSRLEQRGLSHKDFNPQQIWGSSYHTSYSKAQRLYHLTKRFVQPAGEDIDEDRSVCITYGGWTDRQSVHEAASWYVRYTLREPSKNEEEIVVQAELPGKASNSNKKRKVRGGRQMDLGSLLGGFS